MIAPERGRQDGEADPGISPISEGDAVDVLLDGGGDEFHGTSCSVKSEWGEQTLLDAHVTEAANKHIRLTALRAWCPR